VPYKLREIAPESKFSRAFSFDLLQRIVPYERIQAILQQYGAREKRERKLNMVIIVWLWIAMNVDSECSIGHVLCKLAQGLRYIWPDPEYTLPGEPAMTYRRYQLGPRPKVGFVQTMLSPHRDQGNHRNFSLRLPLDGTGRARLKTSQIPLPTLVLSVGSRHRQGPVLFRKCAVSIWSSAARMPWSRLSSGRATPACRVGGFRLLRSGTRGDEARVGSWLS